jgi:shikimate dehydrogenase
LLGLIGAGIQRSLSPELQEEEARRHGLRLHYQLIDLDPLGLGVEALPELLTGAKRLGFGGLNITYPCKQAIIPLLESLSDEARTLNAVNTVVIRDGALTGHNTDCSGYAEGFWRGLPDARLDRVVQLGAGGAGAAVAYAALALGAKRLTLFDPVGARATALAATLSERFGEAVVGAGTDLAAAMSDADGLIHATPTGMAKLPGMPLPAALLRPRHWVSEVVYFPLETELLREARARGCRTLDGGGMAVFQAAGAFRLFTGLEPDAERMLRHFRSLCGTGG